MEFAPHRVKVFAGVILATDADWVQILASMQAEWGRADDVSDIFPFAMTDYYEAEMGEGLTRRLVSFEPLVCADRLPALKHEALALESRFRRPAPAAGRTANIDVGYVDFHRVVLASTKEGPCKIYVGDGIWADMTLRYRKGCLEPFPWTFPDFAEGFLSPFLLRIRLAYKEALRRRRATAATPE